MMTTASSRDERTGRRVRLVFEMAVACMLLHVGVKVGAAVVTDLMSGSPLTGTVAFAAALSVSSIAGAWFAATR